jgi:hypothetical protein
LVFVSFSSVNSSLHSTEAQKFQSKNEKRSWECSTYEPRRSSAYPSVRWQRHSSLKKKKVEVQFCKPQQQLRASPTEICEQSPSFLPFLPS